SDHYRARIVAERNPPEADTHTDAHAIRLGARDIVPVFGGDAATRGRDGGQAYHPGAGSSRAQEDSDLARQAGAEAG
ncbi:MAG: hypothetical protein ACTHJW_25865, partial [Streptosporangiaceae bacterium]